MENDYDLLKNIDVLFNNKNYVYGAGHDGRNIIRIMVSAGIPIEAVVDKNYRGEIYNYKVIDIVRLYEESRQNRRNINIIVASSKYSSQILQEIESKRIKGNIYSHFGVEKSLEIHINDKRILTDFKEERKLIKELKNRDALRTVYEICIHKIIESNPQTLIYQCGKVGSSTMRETLSYYKVDCLQVHILYPENIFFEDMRYDYSLCNKLLKKSPIRIITMVREPISRNISAFFQHNNYSDSMDIEDQVIDYLDKLSLENRPFSWFAFEFEKFTGIDIYQHRFNRDQGYLVIKKEGMEILCLQMEKMKQNEDIIGKFLSIDNFHLIEPCNVGENKISGDIYRRVNKNLRIPQYIIDRYYKGNREMDFFYSEDDKKQFLQKINKCL